MTVTYKVLFRHYDNKFPITIAVEVRVPENRFWGEEIRIARREAWKIIREAVDEGYVAGDYTDYELFSTRRKNG